ncbi:hypothetical protein QFZ80_001438 [Paenibacillus sp. V4I7]|uniref:hypothetical protein n=1 Tax=Paenibacillus sp. V4I5 TaxID=3042306 RepID=UPI0027855F2C|nr:hypothetical protein [Paenibacillus sp. V4I5]MDQ0897610.1 hypothetical protein [Paenibacillus sp. V4I7]MDQ0916384.1 hypothetical protein [Paenibacillus sp. V4I5]
MRKVDVKEKARTRELQAAGDKSSGLFLKTEERAVMLNNSIDSILRWEYNSSNLSLEGVIKCQLKIMHFTKELIKM